MEEVIDYNAKEIHTYQMAFMVFLILLVVYSVLSSYIEHYKITFLHETSVGIFAGFLISL